MIRPCCQLATNKIQKAFQENTTHEEVVSLFFDCDKDGDLDLFIGSGGNNQPPRSPHLEHQLFKNDGKGNFSILKNAFLPNIVNVGTVQAFDFDNDNDLDLFIGARSVSFLYGVTPESHLYLNDGEGHFAEVKMQGSESDKLGMITGSVMADITGDGKKEMIVVGEWMSPKIMEFRNNQFIEIKSTLGNLNGWWQTVEATDLDGDGKCDLILGNIGENFYLKPDSLHPAALWINYFGVDGSIQQLMTRTVDNRNVPVFMKRSMEDQFAYLKKENLKYTSYAAKSAENLFGEKLMQNAVKKVFNFSPSVIAWNEGNGKFTIEKLPTVIQFSSVNSISCSDINNDGKTDIITGGNIFDFSPQFGRLDANYGSVLVNKGGRKFQLLNARQSGIQITGQVRDIKLIPSKTGEYLLFLRNDDFPVLYKNNQKR